MNSGDLDKLNFRVGVGVFGERGNDREVVVGFNLIIIFRMYIGVPISSKF